ncbi:MAG: GNAT family N-acetyltransferase [Sphingomonadales bacterium]
MAADGKAEIRTVGVGAADLLADLHDLCLMPEAERPWSAAEFADLLRQPVVWAAVAHTDGDPAGFVIGRFAGGEGDLLFVGVVPDHRGRGVGETLVTAMAGEARARNAARVVLEVAADNHAAKRLYDRCGFNILGERSGYYTRRDGSAADALVMTLVFKNQ